MIVIKARLTNRGNQPPPSPLLDFQMTSTTPLAHRLGVASVGSAPRMNKSYFAILSSIIYRQIHPSESATVSSLACEVFDQFVAPHYQPEGVTEFHRYAAVEALLKRHEAGHVTLVAERSGDLLGMLHLREPCHISMLFVRSSFQRGGIGRGLLAAATALAGDTDCLFTVNSSPNAVSAYERLGFRISGSEQCVHGIRFVPMQRLSPDGCSA